MATGRTTQDGRPLAISFVDVKKRLTFTAYHVATCMFVFPKELGAGKNATAHLLKCVYGTRDAGQIWEDVYAHALGKMECRRGVANPC